MLGNSTWGEWGPVAGLMSKPVIDHHFALPTNVRWEDPDHQQFQQHSSHYIGTEKERRNPLNRRNKNGRRTFLDAIICHMV